MLVNIKKKKKKKRLKNKYATLWWETYKPIANLFSIVIGKQDETMGVYHGMICMRKQSIRASN